MTQVTGFPASSMTFIMVLVGAGIQIDFNVSNAMAAALGGIAIRHGFGLASPALAGVPCAIIGTIALFALYSREKKNRE